MESYKSKKGRIKTMNIEFKPEEAIEVLTKMWFETPIDSEHDNCRMALAMGISAIKTIYEIKEEKAHLRQ